MLSILCAPILRMPVTSPLTVTRRLPLPQAPYPHITVFVKKTERYKHPLTKQISHRDVIYNMVTIIIPYCIFEKLLRK